MEPTQLDTLPDFGALLTSFGLPATPAGGLTLVAMPAWVAWIIYMWRMPKVQMMLAGIVASVALRSAVWGERIARVVIWERLPVAVQWLSPLVPAMVGAIIAWATGAAGWQTAGLGLVYGIAGAFFYHFAIGQPAGAMATAAAAKLAQFAPRSGQVLGAVAGAVVKVDHDEVKGSADRARAEKYGE